MSEKKSYSQQKLDSADKNRSFLYSNFPLHESRFNINGHLENPSKSSLVMPYQNSNNSKKILKESNIEDLEQMQKNYEYLKEEFSYEKSRLSQELKEMKEKNIELEKKHLMIISDFEKQSLALSEKSNEIGYWKNKFANLETSFSKQSLEVEKLSRNNMDLNEITNKWKEKYSEFEKTYLEQQNQFDALKIKYKRLEKKSEQSLKELSETKEQLRRQETLNHDINLENEKMRRNFQDLELQQQKYIEEIEILKADFQDYKSNHDLVIEETRKEGSKMIEEMHVSYQQILNKRLQSENNCKNLNEQIKDLMNKTQKQEVLLKEKENKILEMEAKLNEAENQISQLNYQVSNYEQNSLKMKNEVSEIYNGRYMGKSRQMDEPGVKLLEAKVEKQKKEIISLKKSLELNEKFKSQEKMVETLKNKEKENEILKEKIISLEKNKQFQPIIDDLKFKIVLISSENERLHTVLKQIKTDLASEKINTTEIIHDNKYGKLSYASNNEDIENFYNKTNENQFQDNFTEKARPLITSRTVPLRNKSKEYYSSNGRPEYNFDSNSNYLSPTYREMPYKIEKFDKKQALLRDYEESNKQLQSLKYQLQLSLQKKEKISDPILHFKENF